MNLKQALSRIRAGVNMPAGDGRLRNTQLAAFWNEAGDMIAKRMIQHDQKHFEVFDSIDVVSGTQEYDIPRHIDDQRITLVERLDASGEVIESPVDFIRFQEKERYRFTASPWINRRAAYIRGRKIGLVPPPSESVTAGLKVYGTQHPHDELWGDIDSDSLTTTTFLIPESPVSEGGKLRAGYCHTEANYYVNAKVRILTGTSGRGIERTITAFNATTRLATIDSAWTAADVTGQEFVIKNSIPDEYGDARVGYVIRQVGIVMKDQTLVKIGTDLWAEWKGEVVADITPRRMDQSQNMEIPQDDLMG